MLLKLRQRGKKKIKHFPKCNSVFWLFILNHLLPSINPYVKIKPSSQQRCRDWALSQNVHLKAYNNQQNNLNQLWLVIFKQNLMFTCKYDFYNCSHFYNLYLIQEKYLLRSFNQRNVFFRCENEVEIYKLFLIVSNEEHSF